MRVTNEVTGYSAWVRSGAEPPKACAPAEDFERGATPEDDRGWPEWDGAIDLYCDRGTRFAFLRFYHVGKPLPPNGYERNKLGETLLYLHAPMASFAPNLVLIAQRVRLHVFFDDGNKVGGLATGTQQPLVASTGQ
jgi:hypothetical protein